MAELIVSVEDPLALRPENAEMAPILIGSFVRAELEGRAVADAVALNRAYLRDGNVVWVMRDDGTLEIRQVEVAWRGADEALVSAGLSPGERVVTTDLATVADGMALRAAGQGE